MDQEIKALLLACELLLVVLRLNDQVAIVALLLDVFVLDFVFDYIDVTCVVSHISCQNHADHSLSENLLLIIRERFNKVVRRFEQQLHSFGSMPVFLHSLVVVPQRAVCHKVDMVGIVVPIVVVVMAG